MFGLTKKQKRTAISIIISLFLFALSLIIFRFFYDISGDNRLIAKLIPIIVWFGLYIFVGYELIIKGFKNIYNKQLLGEDFLMLVASLGAFGLGIYNLFTSNITEGFEEAVAVVLFYKVGQLFESVATEKSRQSIKELLDICPDTANLINNGESSEVFCEEIKVGDTIAIYPGEKIPLDCTIINGESSIDNKALTGESLPIEVKENSILLSGGINLTGELICKVNKTFSESTATQILELVQNATEKKTKTENFVSKFAKYYTPIVIALALLTAFIPPILFGGLSTWLYRSLSFLVVSCPCALVISVPMTYFVALGKASQKKVLIKGSCYLETLAKAKTFVFDKTGTLTKGEFAIKEILPNSKKDEILRLAYIAEQNSSHPIAKCITDAYKGEQISGYTHTNFAGFGVKAVSDKDEILCGNYALLQANGITPTENKEGAIYLAKNGYYVGLITIEDSIKTEVNGVIGALNKENCKTIMLTGDTFETAKNVSERVGVNDFKANLLPQDKLFEVEKLLAQKQPNDTLCFVGDGINDAPVLTRSDLGVAMGALGSDAAIESADVVLLRDDLQDLLYARNISKRAVKIVKQNVIFSILIKCLILILSFFGITNVWVSIFGDVGVAVLAILNALRV
ncbi:MAG: cadmium-translocating P-type ATPase [Clostridia bacterium]|nr:cadmium-translocating P-type ATPase [Clostridia bacterium]